MVEEKSEARVEYMTCYISYRPQDGSDVKKEILWNRSFNFCLRQTTLLRPYRMLKGRIEWWKDEIKIKAVVQLSAWENLGLQWGGTGFKDFQNFHGSLFIKYPRPSHDLMAQNPAKCPIGNTHSSCKFACEENPTADLIYCSFTRTETSRGGGRLLERVKCHMPSLRLLTLFACKCSKEVLVGNILLLKFTEHRSLAENIEYLLPQLAYQIVMS